MKKVSNIILLSLLFCVLATSCSESEDPFKSDNQCAYVTGLSSGEKTFDNLSFNAISSTGWTSALSVMLAIFLFQRDNEGGNNFLWKYYHLIGENGVDWWDFNH